MAKKTLLELLGLCDGDETKAVGAWLHQQSTETVFNMFACFCGGRIKKLEAFRRAARENAEMTLFIADGNSQDDEINARVRAIARQRLRAIAGEPPMISDYEEYVKKYAPTRYEELCSEPERVFVASPRDLEKTEEEV